MASESTINVTDNQRRAIATTLGLFDETLSQFERWASGDEIVSVLYRQINNLSPAQRLALRQEIDATRQTMRAVRDKLELQPRTQDVGQAIWSLVASYWPAMEELHPDHLRRYGKVTPESKEYLAEMTENLVGHVTGLMKIVGGGKDGGND